MYIPKKILNFAEILKIVPHNRHNTPTVLQKKMKEQETPKTDYSSMMKARKEGLVVQSEREFREEQTRVVENNIRHAQNLFDNLYGGMVTQKQRNEYYNVIARERRKRENANADFYPKTVRKKMQHVRQLVEELRQLGVHEASITDLLRPERPISRLYITPDYRIFLPEFNNLEVQFGPLPRAVFILFLRHPEGIVLKEINDYFSELLDIYKVVMGPKFKESKALSCLARICNPTTNSLNENISRIHDYLRTILDETIAASYYICGKRAEARQILIPQALINWG